MSKKFDFIDAIQQFGVYIDTYKVFIGDDKTGAFGQPYETLPEALEVYKQAPAPKWLEVVLRLEEEAAPTSEQEKAKQRVIERREQRKEGS